MPNKNISDKEQRRTSLVQLLTTTGGYSAEELAQMLQVTPKTIYQDLKYLERLGYQTEKKGRNRIFLINADERKLVDFTPEEARFLDELIAGHTNPLAASIRHRLLVNQAVIPLGQATREIKRAEVIHRLNKALNTGKMVRILGYRSASSNSIKTRIITPFDFLPDYQSLRARENGEVKVFKVSRMAEVEVLDESGETKPELPPADDFGMFGPHRFEVLLRLTNRAAYLLEEEYPLVAQRIQPTPKTDFPYQIRLSVCKPEGIGRFVLGLLDQVEVVEGEQLKTYLSHKLQIFAGAFGKQGFK